MVGLENMYCFDFSKDLYIEGDYSADKFADIEIVIKPCREPEKP